jgi:iron complex outermembrane receptor protein
MEIQPTRSGSQPTAAATPAGQNDRDVTKRARHAWLNGGTALCGAALLAALPQAAMAQQVATALDEVVVTATRQSSTVNRVPISITAATQATLDQKGIKDLAGVSQNTPGVQFTSSVGGQSFDVNIRGVASPVGAPTTGIYIDDTPIGRRGGANANSFAGFSTPAPKLFDLDRVEVLRGPQGTLYGGSAMGGAVRFINPTPSLTTYSSYARAEVSSLKEGSKGWELGVAVGGPIIQDKLGFRASVWRQHTPGWIDHINMFHTGVDNVAVPGVSTQEVVMDRDTNSGDAQSARLALLWAPTENLRIQPALFVSRDVQNDSNQWMGTVPEYLVKGGSSNNNPSFPAYAPLPVCNASLGNVITPATIAAGCFPNQGNYSWRAYRDGPYNLGYGRTGNGLYTDTSPTGGRAAYAISSIHFMQPSLTIDWDLPQVLIHSSTSMIQDLSKSAQEGKFGSAGQPVATQFMSQNLTGGCGNSATSENWQDFEGGCSPLFIKRGADDNVGFPQLYQNRSIRQKRQAIFQELRLSSPGDQRPFTWVAGVFFGYNKLTSWQREMQNVNLMAEYITQGNTCAGFGSYTCKFLSPTTETLPNGLGFTSASDSVEKDTEVAGFADASYFVTEQLRLTAGVRVSRISYDISRRQSGPHGTGLPLGYTPTAARPFAVNDAACPNQAAGCPWAYDVVSITESPVTPKFGVSYQANETTLLYANAAKGFRPGGQTPNVNPAICSQDFAELGITATPSFYKSDSIWSYEGGFKARLFNVLQLNMAGYQIDWDSPQTTLTLARCGRGYTGNAGKSRVRGVDGDMTWSVTSNLTFQASGSLTDGVFTERLNALGTNPNATPQYQEGEKMLNVPQFSYTLGVAYARPITSSMDGYIRADMQHIGRFVRRAAKGSAGWNPLVRHGESRDNVQVRAGVRYNAIDVNVFVNNLLNDKSLTNAVYGNFVPGVFHSSVNPRQIGLQITYRN